MKIFENLSASYAQLRPDGSSEKHDAASFWQNVEAGRIENEGFGHLVGVYEFSEDWPTWEVHPAGDEVVYVLEGAIELILKHEGTDQPYDLHQGQACLVPKGVWHTAKVSGFCRTLHITPGDGSENREQP